MRKFYLFFLLILLFVSCGTPLNNERPVNEPKADSRTQTEIRFAQAIQGIPLVIPLPEESDSTLFLMPASNDNNILKVDKLYLVDSTREKFVFERDIYEIKHIERIDETEDSSCKYIAVVSNVLDKTQHEYEINGYMYHLIWKINNGKWDYPSAIKIPIMVRSSTTKEIREDFRE